nr:JmjC domain-containing protein [Tanacetum cinerariifolium]
LSKLVLETITSPIRDDYTGGGSFHESPPRPPPVTPHHSSTVRVAEEPLTLTSLLTLFPTCLQSIATLEAELNATRILHKDTVVLFAKRIKKLESKLKSKKRKLVLSDSETEEEARQSQELDTLLDLANATLHEPSHSTTPSKPVNLEQSSEQEISQTTLDAVLTLSQSKARARASMIIYKRLKKQQSSFGLDFTNAAISAGGLDFAGGVDSAFGLDSAGGPPSAGILVAVGLTVPPEPLSPIRDPSKGKVKLKQSIDAEQVYMDSLLAQRVAEEQERESMASAAQSTHRHAELDRVALNLTNEEWIGLMDQVRANPTLSAELLGADVSEDTFSVRMVDLRNRRRKVIVEMKAKAKREKPMTPAQQKEFMHTFIRRAVELTTAKDHHQHLKQSDDPEADFKRYLRQASDDDEPTEPVSLALVSDITTWEIIPTEFGLGEIHVLTRADGTVKRFSTLRELMYWVGKADLMVLYGFISDKYKTERATGIGLVLWMDLRILDTSREERDASIIWDDQDQWQIQS